MQRRSAPGAMLTLIVAIAAARCGAQPITGLSGQIDLARLVDLAVERLHLNVEYDATALKGNVTLRLGGGVTDEELWTLTNRVLASRGFTTVRAPGSDVISVVKTSDAAGLSRFRGEASGEPATGAVPEAGFDTVIVRLKHRAAKDVTDPLGRVLSKPGGSVAAMGDPNTVGGLLLLSDLTPRVAQAMTLLEALDSPAGRAVVEEVAAANIPASALATLVAQVAAKRELVSGEKVPGEVLPSPAGNGVLIIAPEERTGYWRDLITSLDRRERAETVVYTPTAFAAAEVGSLIEQSVRTTLTDDRWRLVVDELTGTLIVTATPSQHGSIRALLERLESAPRGARRPVRAFVIRNRNISELAAVLQGLLQAGVLEGDGQATEAGVKPIESIILPTLAPGQTSLLPAPMQQPSEPARDRPASRPGQGSGQGGGQAGDSSRPGSGDAQPPMVFTIDEGTSTLIAMGEPRLLEQLATLIARLDVRQPQVMLEVLLVSLTEAQTLNLGVELQALDLSGDTVWRVASLFGLSARAPDGTPNVGAPSGLSGVVLNPGDFSVVLRALKTVNGGRSLSIPKVLIGNNQQATFDSILEQPFATINASNTVSTTTSFGGSSAAGTQISIKPQIAGGGEGDHLILDYQVSLSSFTGAAADANLPPPKQTNKLASIATIPDGHTVAVGGIDLTNDSQSESRVPILAALPIIGEAFKSRSNVNNRTRFYVFIRANVLRARGFEDLKYLSAEDVAAARVDDGFPEVEPRIMR